MIDLSGARRTLLAYLVLAVACGGDDPAGPSPSTIPDIVGTYAGTWQNGVAVPARDQETEITCPGSVIVSEQDADGRFTGFWTQVGNAECVAAAGALAGRVAAGGALTVSEFSNATGESLEEATGGFCASPPGGSAFSGTADGSRFELFRTVVADCQGTEFTFSWVLSARK